MKVLIELDGMKKYDNRKENLATVLSYNERG